MQYRIPTTNNSVRGMTKSKLLYNTIAKEDCNYLFALLSVQILRN